MHNSRDMAVRVASIYAACALLWVLGSDMLVRQLPAAVFSAAQSAKAVLFVFVTSVVLYLLVERLAERMQREALSATSVEKMLGQVVSSVPVGIVLTSDDGTVTFLNRRAEAMIGLTADDAVGKSIDDVCCTDGTQAALLGELMTAGSVDEITVGGRGGVQSRRAFARASQIDPGVPASGWIIAFADISDAQREASETERRAQGLRFLSQGLQACVRASDERMLLRRIAEIAVSSGRYIGAWAVIRSAGSGFEDIAMVDLGDRTREVAAYLHESARGGRQMPNWSTSEENGIVVSNDLARDPANIWHPAALEDRFGSIANLIVKRNGAVFGSIGLFARDVGAFDAQELELLEALLDEITFAMGKLTLERQRMDAEQELEHSERGYRALFEHHPAPMWVYDLETLAFLEVNDAAISKYGYSREEFSRMTIRDIRPAEDVPRLLSSISQITEGFEDAGIWTHRDSSGREFPAHVYSHTVEWNGRNAELVMVLEVARVE